MPPPLVQNGDDVKAEGNGNGNGFQGIVYTDSPRGEPVRRSGDYVGPETTPSIYI